MADKSHLRKGMLERRKTQGQKDFHSDTICRKVMELPQFATAQTVMLYVDTRSEVRTRRLLMESLSSGRRVLVPYCEKDDLIPLAINTLDELSPGAFGILEPRSELRSLSERRIDPLSIDVICIPGIAFDRHGNRLGSGWGFYDRLLPRLGPHAAKIALSFASQLVAQVPVEPHDVTMDVVVTEEEVLLPAQR